MIGQTGQTQNLHKYQNLSSPRVLALIQFGAVFLQVNINVLLVTAHTETTHQSRSMPNYKQNTRTQSSEANHNGDTRICFLKFRFTKVNPTSPLRNSLGVSLFQLNPFELGLFQPLHLSTILILSTNGAGSHLHRLVAAHHTVGS